MYQVVGMSAQWDERPYTTNKQVLARVVKVQVIFGANNGDIRYLVVGIRQWGPK